MITILSPAKALDFSNTINTKKYSLPIFQNESVKLITKLQKIPRKKLMDVMDISEKLADLNYNRYQEWNIPFTTKNAKPAITAFNGEVYNGLKASELSEEQLIFANDHIRILSGLHGILSPLDIIQPYRLEMGSKLKVGKSENLYEFWANKIQDELKRLLGSQKTQILINLASNEYSKAAKLKTLGFDVITPVFKELTGDEYKVIFVYTKKARGLMARYIIDNKINDPEQIKLFDSEGYFYNDHLSSIDQWVFTR